jgi:hypothetical protein
MANEKEPQSYGSGGDWVTGNVGEEVNRLKGHPNSQQGDFYESRHESDRSAPEQGGKVSPEQIEENVQPADAPEVGGDAPTRNVSMAEGGAKRGSYFRDRDYK